MKTGHTSREALKAALRRYLDRQGTPKFHLSLITAVAAVAGLLSSIFLLKAGVAGMWLRYPIAAAVGYGVFLSLVKIWAWRERDKIESGGGDVRAQLTEGSGVDGARRSKGGRSERESRWGDGWDIPDIGIDVELFLPLVLLGALVGLVFLLISFVAGAPALLSEVLLDALLASFLYRRLRTIEGSDWLGAGVRNTWGYAAGAAILLSIVGFCLDQLAPDSDSLGRACSEMFYRVRQLF